MNYNPPRFAAQYDLTGCPDAFAKRIRNGEIQYLGLSQFEAAEYAALLFLRERRALSNPEFARFKELKEKKAAKISAIASDAVAHLREQRKSNAPAYHAPRNSENYIGNPNAPFAQTWGE